MADDSAETVVTGIGSILVGVILLGGIVVAQLPQVISFLRYRSTRGISFLTFLLGNITSMATFINVLMLNWEELGKYCPAKDSILCGQYSVVVVQLAVLWFMYSVNLGLYMIFLRKPDRMLVEDHELDEDYLGFIDEDNFGGPTAVFAFKEKCLMSPTKPKDIEFPDPDAAEKRKIRFISANLMTYIVFALYLVGAFVCVGLSVLLSIVVGTHNYYVEMIGHLFGLFSSVIIFVQWVPQIIKCLVDKSGGRLSLVMISIMMPGSFITMLYLIASGQGFSTWISYLASGIQQLVLWIILIIYAVRDRIQRRNEHREEESEIR